MARTHRTHITLAHGAGGRLMHELIDSIAMKELDNPVLKEKRDAATVTIGRSRIAFTTDSYVVSPLFFPGGDIGSLAVHGTVNDLAVCGARPRYITLGAIIEEGLDIEVLRRVIRSSAAAARRAGVAIVAGDTKVVEKGSCDKLFLNTSGIGEVYYDGLSLDRVTAGDSVIASGPIGDHELAILMEREGIGFASKVVSDSAPLNGLIARCLAVSGKVRFMRDPTRGGVATTLNEIVAGRPFGIALDERSIPLSKGARSACEVLGLDPLYLACEGRFLMIVARQDAKKVLAVMHRHPLGRSAAVIGETVRRHAGRVFLATVAGGTRLVDMLVGEQLPRIC